MTHPRDAAAASLASYRDAIIARAREVGRLTPGDGRFFHGRAFLGVDDDDAPSSASPASVPPLPRVTWHSPRVPRPDHDAPPWLTASEYEDEPAVATAKARQLARMLLASRFTVLYTGAGISASVVGQAARSGRNKRGWKGKGHEAEPTPTHFALARLCELGLVRAWVQQNHDGLPQKAGAPQELVNEIHGSWFDPSNPVVKYHGTLAAANLRAMDAAIARADLALVIGTSLSGLNADRVATETASKLDAKLAMGAVVVNLQQTPEDGAATLRAFGASDDVTRETLGFIEEALGRERRRVDSPSRTLIGTMIGHPATTRALVPYDRDGRRLPRDARRYMWLDLADGAEVHVTPGHNIAGAKQPAYERIQRDGGRGSGKVAGYCARERAFRIELRGATMRLGAWWVDAAARGAVDVLPVVNAHPEFEDTPPTRRGGVMQCLYDIVREPR